MNNNTIMRRFNGIILNDENTSGGVIHMELIYKSDDPYSLEARFVQTCGTTVWNFGRDLLLTGINTHSGNGDVEIGPRGLVLEVTLHGSSTLTMQFHYDEILTFVVESVNMVPPGHETLKGDLDAELEKLPS